MERYSFSCYPSEEAHIPPLMALLCPYQAFGVFFNKISAARTRWCGQSILEAVGKRRENRTEEKKRAFDHMELVNKSGPQGGFK